MIMHYLKSLLIKDRNYPLQVFSYAGMFIAVPFAKKVLNVIGFELCQREDGIF